MHFTVLLGNRKIKQGPRDSTAYAARLVWASLRFHYPSTSGSAVNQPTGSHPSLAVQGSLLENLCTGKGGNLPANTSNICVCLGSFPEGEKCFPLLMLSLASFIIRQSTSRLPCAVSFWIERGYTELVTTEQKQFFCQFIFVTLTWCSLEVISGSGKRTPCWWMGSVLQAHSLLPPVPQSLADAPGLPAATQPIVLAGSCPGTVGTTCCKFSSPCYLCSSSQPFKSQFHERRGKDSLCLMFNLQFCFPETLQINGFDYILRTPSVTQRAINSCCYPLQKAKLCAVRLLHQQYKSNVVPKTAKEQLYRQVTQLLWSHGNKRTKVPHSCLHKQQMARHSADCSTSLFLPLLRTRSFSTEDAIGEAVREVTETATVALLQEQPNLYS